MPADLRADRHDVSIHTLREGRLSYESYHALAKEFQPTPLREGRPRPRHSTSPLGCFNPRPYGRGDTRGRMGFWCQQVSIHAPTGGATRGNLQGQAAEHVSIHAPTGGATQLNGQINLFLGFNPRPYGRGDGPWIKPCCRSGVSIHAPTGGATGPGSRTRSHWMFQSTPLREGRHMVGWTTRMVSMFQSTPLREGRRWRREILSILRSFNPRPYGRGDTVPRESRPRDRVSIHAPTGGATPGCGIYP